jgi:putative membrane protein
MIPPRLTPLAEPQLHGPVVVDYDGEAADPSSVIFAPDPVEWGAVQTVVRVSERKTSGLAKFAFWVFSSLFLLLITTSAWRFVTDLFAANTGLGWVAFALFTLALGVVLVLALAEVLTFSRMARIDRIRTEADMAYAANDRAKAKQVVAKLIALYTSRPELAWAIADLKQREPEVFDGDALLVLAQEKLMTTLDQRALREIEAAARQVATITAFVPLALADVATALYVNNKLIRKLSLIYGGRSGSLGSIRLMRRVFSALLGAGAIALADDLIGSAASGGILSKLSRRFGEGVVNGALTARVGIAAMELSRPLPFLALAKPNTTATVTRALAGLFGQKDVKSDEV